MISGQLATEKHGTEKKAFIDLKFTMLLDRDDINTWLQDPQATSGGLPFDCIFTEGNELRLPALALTGKIRDNLKGDLLVKDGGRKEMSFSDAHIVGTTSKLEFQTGGHGKLTLQLRIEPGTLLQKVVDLIETAECSFHFVEYDDNPNAGADDENQGQMPV